jgi:hypothetical protein
MMEDDNTTRIENEFALLEAMYPEEVVYIEKSKEVQYNHAGSSLLLRLSDAYPQSEKPQIISATNSNKMDLRDKLKAAIASLPTGEEALDSFVNAFRELLDAEEAEAASKGHSNYRTSNGIANLHRDAKKQTTIIWLHHLLNTNKRKLALSPLNDEVSGISKPGYPGVLIFSGSASAVQEHVNILKQQNWAAFQVRYEDATEWKFEHGSAVKEVESMAEIVKDIGDRKDEFLDAMRMR